MSPRSDVPIARVTIEGDRWKWVRVSDELLAELGEWSEPVRIMVVSETDGILDMVFQRADEASHGA